MKTLNQILTAAVVMGSFGILDATASGLQSGTVSYGQSGQITFLKGSEPKSKSKVASDTPVAKSPEKVEWKKQSVPNGPAITFAVPQQPHFEIAPLK